MKLLFFLLLFVPSVSFAQALNQFHEEKSRIDQRLMIGLGSWATSNFIVSGIGWATTTKGEAHYFHQMNVMWNLVNLGLAIPGYIKAKNEMPPQTLSETMRLQRKTENIFLFNTGLDVLYVSSGFLLRNLALKNVDKRDQYNGFGNGMIMQGGFLFLFDLTAYAIHKYHAKHGMPKASMSIRMSSNGTGLTWNIGNQSVSKHQVFL
jgi:hypothetical protein